MGRSPCCDKNGLKKGPWTPEEDQKLVDYIQKHGYGNWRTLPKNAGLQRCGKSCRLRWTNYLRPDIKRGRFSFEEEETIVQLHSILGNKWSAIAARLPGRTDNEIKNYWNTHIRKRLLRMGIDPVTHSPRLDLLDFSSILYNPSHHHHQVNFPRLLGMEQMGLNPELLRLATSLLSSHRERNSNFFIQNDHHQQQQQQQQLCSPQNDQIPLHLVQSSQLQEPFQENAPVCATLDTCAIPFPHEAQPSTITDFSSQNCQISEWQSNGEVPSDFTESQYVQLPSLTYYDGSSDNQIISDISPETSNLYSYNSNNQNFNFPSVFSTPSSSPTPLNSNSTTYFNSGTEDERESYCSNMMKFDIPDIFDDFIRV